MAKARIISGVHEPLGAIPFHGNTPVLERVVHANADVAPELGQHIVVHHVSIPKGKNVEPYAEEHAHEVQEINLVSSDKPGGLTFKFVLEGKEHIIKSPATIVIPAGVRHSANAVKGKGTYVCIVNAANYLKSLKK